MKNSLLLIHICLYELNLYIRPKHMPKVLHQDSHILTNIFTNVELPNYNK
jgi:hypothetical protein